MITFHLKFVILYFGTKFKPESYFQPDSSILLWILTILAITVIMEGLNLYNPASQLETFLRHLERNGLCFLQDV